MTDVTPALTREEWEERERGFEHYGRMKLHSDGALEVRDAINAPALLRNKERHALAALALHGQAFGFTHEDVGFLRYGAQHARDTHGELIAEAFDFDSIAARIAALLPPSTTGGSDEEGKRREGRQEGLLST